MPLQTWLAIFLEQSPSSEASNHSASQEIPRSLRKPMVYYRVHNGSPLVPILSQMNPAHYFQPYFPKIHQKVKVKGKVVLVFFI
jgi:hypothetical protein